MSLPPREHYHRAWDADSERETQRAAEFAPLTFAEAIASIWSVTPARPEDLVVQKVVADRPVDAQDVERLLGLHARTIDLGRVRRLIREVAEALDDPGRAARF